MIIENGCYTVYTLIDKINGFLYVGQTSKSPKERFGRGTRYKENIMLNTCIEKHGWDNIEQNIVASNLTKEEADNFEKLLIRKFREQCPELVCNRDAGGSHGKHSQETIDLIRAGNIGRTRSDETRARIKEARSKQIISHESIMKSAEKNRGKKRSADFCENNGKTHSKRILCVETGREYNSATEASKDLNVSISGISQVCKGTIPHIKGLHFKYA